MIRTYFIFTILIICSLAACNLEKEIDLQLPEYQSQVAVECYLEVGEPFTLLLTKSSAYFDPFPTLDESLLETLLEQDATVSVTVDGKTYELENEIGFNPFTGKIYNYGSDELVPADMENDFVLNITTQSGSTISGTTRLLSVIPSDSIVVEFSETVDTLARLLAYYTDDETQENWYRRIWHEGTLDTVLLDFALTDQFVDNGTLVFGTGYDFTVGDTVFSTLVHISEPYYEFLTSIAGAVDANGNPFGQPSSILSNVTGSDNPIGIFTGLATTRESIIVTD